MTFPSIRIEGQIFSGELLERLDQPDLPGQRPADFGLAPDAKVKDEIATAWAASQSYYRAFRVKISASTTSESTSSLIPPPLSLTSETRNLLLLPLLSLLGYKPEFSRRGEALNGKSYPISHRDDSRDGLPIHLLGWNDSLDHRRSPSATQNPEPGTQNPSPRMSAHALVQEYLNLSEHLYGIVSNGRTLRLLRDSTRLIRQSFIEFDLERMFEDDLFADFAVLFRLLHASRLPTSQADAPTSLVEKYHQDALDQGSRIREGLSKAVERTILSFANGFLTHPDNDALRESVGAASGELRMANGAEAPSSHSPFATHHSLSASAYYNHLLRLIYRFLFLLVTEERRLIFPPTVPARKRDLYYRHYSLQRIRRLAEKPHLVERRHKDLWLGILATFRLFEAGGPGHKLEVAPLAGDLFSPDAIGPLGVCALDNGTVLDCLAALSLYQNPDTHQRIRVNYAALNVEEFGSVYEGLLEYEPVFLGRANPQGEPSSPNRPRANSSRLGTASPSSALDAHQMEGEAVLSRGHSSVPPASARITFAFKQGDERAATGSHYTPDELVQPLIKHSLDYLIADKLKEPDKEKSLLSLRIADISCGSGHILLAAARRIATELAIVRTGEEQPSPAAFRAAVRDVIRECIYGVDLNPLAVELCKVALWLEAHNPGQPLNFLDHHIKCGNAIVGYARLEDVERGIPDEAFKALPGDDKDVAAALRKRNKAERKERQQAQLDFSPAARQQLGNVLQRWQEIAGLPETTPEEIAAKKARYEQFVGTADAWLLRQILAIPIAQFYLPKTDPKKLTTDADFRRYWSGQRHPQGEATAAAFATAHQNRFFHWFLEFPEIFQSREPATSSAPSGAGGFDCILGNPPYLGGQALSGTHGHPFCEYVKWEYAPAGLSDLVAYFVRRIYGLLRPDGFTAFITTNSIKDGDIRKDGLEQVIAQGGAINLAVRGIRWPGRANLVVSLVALHKGEWFGPRKLDGANASYISAFFEESEDHGDPKPIQANASKLYQGSVILGDGFFITPHDAARLIQADQKNREVIQRIINGSELNGDPLQEPGRWIISFWDWSREQAADYAGPYEIVETHVRPERIALAANERNLGAKERWWQYIWSRPELYAKNHCLGRCFVAARTTKYLNFSATATSYLFTDAIFVFTTERWDLYAVVQSTIHEVWARKYSGTLETRLRYSPSDCFETYPFPAGQWQTPLPALAAIGERYHEHRRGVMLGLWLGLTDLYNLFHEPDLEKRLRILFEKRAKTPAWREAIPADKRPSAGSLTYEAALAAILDLRRLHVALDTAVRDAYGWPDLPLGHTFVDVETLPENDRTRFTITPETRKELLRRLLAENQRRAVAVPAQAIESGNKASGRQADSTAQQELTW